MNRKAINTLFIHIYKKSPCVKMSEQRQMMELDIFGRKEERNTAMTLS